MAANNIQVQLLDHSHDPVQSLYIAYRTCYSSLTPQRIAQDVAEDKVTHDQMWDFIERRFEVGHNSPLEQVWFEYLIAGVSRAMSHQLVRHRTGISFEQQSQRYVLYKGGKFPYTIPQSIVAAGMDDKVKDYFTAGGTLYIEMVNAGVNAEDARFVLPNATNTNFKITVNFAELQHICDLRLCVQAQWEFRKVASLMRAEVNKLYPRLAKYLQPKCGERRQGYCDESYEDWSNCPIGTKRPHKRQLMAMWDNSGVISESDFALPNDP